MDKAGEGTVILALATRCGGVYVAPASGRGVRAGLAWNWR
jgi:hypothetical protein